MLNGITLLTNDFYWASILRDLHANVIPTVAKEARGLKFDIPKEKISIPKLSNHIEQLKMKRLAELGGQNLSAAEQRLILLLPATANELKSAMGYAEESATHTTETLIYNIRKKMGNDYIKFNNGKYEL
jgi:hypothetical protein